MCGFESLFGLRLRHGGWKSAQVFVDCCTGSIRVLPGFSCEFEGSLVCALLRVQSVVSRISVRVSDSDRL